MNLDKNLSEKIKSSTVAAAAAYPLLRIASQMAKEIFDDKAEKTRFIKHQYELGIAPDAKEIAAGITRHCLHNKL